MGEWKCDIFQLLRDNQNPDIFFNVILLIEIYYFQLEGFSDKLSKAEEEAKEAKQILEDSKVSLFPNYNY